MKILAAHRAGLTTVILPKKNERDLDDLPEDVHKSLTFVTVEQIDQAMTAALVPEQSPPPQHANDQKN